MSIKNPLEQEWSRRNKFLSQALIFSGALNIALLSTFFYFALTDSKNAVEFQHPPVQAVLDPALSNEVLLLKYSTLSFYELMELLENQDKVEAGYKKRDLALASLVAFHHFNLDKALGSPVSQKRQVSFFHNGQEQVDLYVFPGLLDDQFQAILRFAKTERWPVTSEGLFFEIKQSKSPRETSLLEAFYLTPEFYAMSTLFVRSGFAIQKEVLVDLISQGDWNILKEFSEEQKQVQDLSPARLRAVLLKFLKNRSLLAAKILLEIDRDFIVKQLDDTDLFLLVDMVGEKSGSFDLLAKDLLFSPRSDAIWRKVGEKLYTFAGVPVPQPYDHQMMLRTFFPANIPPPSVATAPSPPAKAEGKRTYVVQKGDNLWKIAHKHRISVDALKKANRLESEKLKPGKELEIPDKVKHA